ncbi:MAG: NAD(P)H-dependent oxidoreductase [Deltaproteobacteria bacterium]|nr:NAD(P)H-dependent oxidoreductase [Deltaproteobacteria bacterium]
MKKSKLDIVVVSTRPGRKGPAVAGWMRARAEAHAGFDVRLTDLAEANLPIFDEPDHPRAGRYVHEHTKAFSRRMMEADAFVFVTPEYNFGMPPAFLNALNYLAREWAYAPAAFVSYGGVSGGTRSVQMAKQIVTTLKMMPIPEAVSIPFFQQHLKDSGDFEPGEQQEKAATGMLDELLRWTLALSSLRAEQRG